MAKKISLIVLVCLVLAMVSPTYASENEADNLLPMDLSQYEEQISEGGISLFASFSVKATNLAAGKYATSGSEFYLVKGVDGMSVNFTWSPTGKNVKIGFLNPQKVFYSVTCKSGSYSATLWCANTPTGNYKVAIFNPTTDDRKITGTAVCTWK